MSGNSIEDQWYVYWDGFYQAFSKHPKREPVFRAFIDASPGVLTREGLAEEAASRMVEQGLIEDKSEFEADNVDNYLPDLENLHLNLRSPQFGDSGYINMPNPLLCDWLGGISFGPALRPHSLPSNPATNRLGSSIVESWDIEATNAASRSMPEDDRLSPEKVLAEGASTGSLRPHKMLLYAFALSHVDGPNPEDVTLHIGSLDHLRETEATELAEDLTVHEAFPDPNGTYAGDEGVHDYGIFGRINEIETIYDRGGLERTLGMQTATWLAASRQIYDVKHNREDDKTEVTGLELTQAAQTLHQQRRKTGGLRRFDLDTVVTEPSDNAAGDVTFGIYNRDQP